MHTSLFAPLQIGSVRLAHRVVMSPLTRMRASTPGNVPTELNALYYGQRSSEGGLIVAEATQIRADGQGSPATPGIHSADQVDGWRKVVSAAHAAGANVFAQLWHVGRISHSSHQPDGGIPLAPSPVAASGMALTASWTREPYPVPRPVELGEIPALVQSYVQAAKNALAAGFDGIEVSAGNGYLLEQFMQSRTNHRTDQYGGSVINRCRLAIEVIEAVTSVANGRPVGIRLSPFGVANDSGEDDPMPVYACLLESAAKLGVDYLHVVEPRASGIAARGDVPRPGQPFASALLRPLWPGILIANGGFDGASAAAAIEEGSADAVSFGRMFISNPDLPRRIRQGATLTPYDRTTFYGGDARGYTDYPTLGELPV
ncbi:MULTISPECIES: alkene reductase [Paraburkholderia]|uniref:Alkene reductase n=1 Tax=Paraburkholderia madseniana TaxID=2599607 RepID=A0AAP5BKD0_9BURK|nr:MULTISPECIES: alkene reductase [Paraburkholderia]MCX4150274.1 alkene reductase [Paraburkholderia madseniana]MDN7153208.1 alkene reductase [Paraburkholderia sp. WS6]MDQ6412090.1 alkene reductase [Paraburkholderia madseniana]